MIARIESRNATDAVAYLLSGELADVKRMSKAEVQFALTGSTTYAFTGLLANVATLVAESFLLLVITATFLLVNPGVSVFTLVYFGLVVVVIQVFIGRSVKRAAEHAVAGTVATNDTLSDVLDTFREITVLGKQHAFVEAVTGSRRRIARSNATMTYLAGMPRYVVETALILGVVILVAQQFLAGGLASGLVTVGVFLAGGVRMMSSLLPLQAALANIRNNAEQAQPALALLERMHAHPAPAVVPADVGHLAAGGLPIRLDDVHYRYPGNLAPTIDGIDLTVRGGDQVAIIGPSGAGKTTLVDLLLGLGTPDSGSVEVGDADPVRLRAALPGAVTYVPQRPGLVSGTIADNIALGIPAEDVDRARLDEVIDAAFLRKFVDSLPDGADTSVGKQTDALSGGQIQRIGVARALYSRPRLIVLDEATSGLDASSEDAVSASLRALHGDVTVVIIAHRLSTVQHADEVFVIEEGRVLASGDFTSVRRDVPMVAEYVKLMSFGDERDAG
jgi:ATP-binding cassette subfamily C protein